MPHACLNKSIFVKKGPSPSIYVSAVTTRKLKYKNVSSANCIKLCICNENVTWGLKETIIRLIEVCVYYHSSSMKMSQVATCVQKCPSSIAKIKTFYYLLIPIITLHVCSDFYWTIFTTQHTCLVNGSTTQRGGGKTQTICALMSLLQFVCVYASMNFVFWRPKNIIVT